MGYYTTYELQVDDNQEQMHINNIGKLYGYDCFNERTKWYTWYMDMLAYSKQFPLVLFTISGIGEDANDYWRGWIRNGKGYHEYAAIAYPEFDTDKLE